MSNRIKLFFYCLFCVFFGFFGLKTTTHDDAQAIIDSHTSQLPQPKPGQHQDPRTADVASAAASSAGPREILLSPSGGFLAVLLPSQLLLLVAVTAVAAEMRTRARRRSEAAASSPIEWWVSSYTGTSYMPCHAMPLTLQSLGHGGSLDGS